MGHSIQVAYGYRPKSLDRLSEGDMSKTLRDRTDLRALYRTTSHEPKFKNELKRTTIALILSHADSGGTAYPSQRPSGFMRTLTL